MLAAFEPAEIDVYSVFGDAYAILGAGAGASEEDTAFEHVRFILNTTSLPIFHLIVCIFLGCSCTLTLKRFLVRSHWNQEAFLTALRRCRLGSRKLDQLILLVKNWPDDPRQGCDANYLDDFGVEEADTTD